MNSIKALSKLSKKELALHLSLYLIGIVFMPLGAVLTIKAHLGAGGYDAMNFAIADLLHINTSVAIYGTAFLVLILTALIRKSRPRITTFISSFFLGIFTDIWKAVLVQVEGTDLLISIPLFLLGMLLCSVGVAAYMLSIFPTNPTDDLVVALTERGCPLSAAKIGLDLVCVILALLLHGEVGVGTIVCTFGLGVFIQLFYKMFQRITGF